MHVHTSTYRMVGLLSHTEKCYLWLAEVNFRNCLSIIYMYTQRVEISLQLPHTHRCDILFHVHAPAFLCSSKARRRHSASGDACLATCLVGIEGIRIVALEGDGGRCERVYARAFLIFVKGVCRCASGDATRARSIGIERG